MTAGDWIRALSRQYPDFPNPGILFQDLTPVFANRIAFTRVVDELANDAGSGIDVVAGVEARGFLLAGAVARALGCGVLALRKAGRLPGEVIEVSYDLEYGSASLELHPGGPASTVRTYVVDDVLATGGTLAAATTLVERAGYSVAGIGVVLEILALDGRSRLAQHSMCSLAEI